MTAQIRLLGGVLLLCFVVLFAQLNRLTLIEAGELNEHPLNTRQMLRDFNQPRGAIVTADGVVIAHSLPTEGVFDLQRHYPEGALFGHVTGFFSLTLGSSGLERSYHDDLAGRTLDIELRELSDLFVERERVGDLTLALRADLQRVARDQLGDRRGSVVVLDPRSGAVRALWSNPSFDPNLLSNHDQAAAAAAQRLLDAAPDRPRRSRAYQERFFPGSTFKVVTAAAGIASGQVTESSPYYPRTDGYVAPGTIRPIRNFGGDTCGGALVEIMRISCNTAFAQMGVDLGPELMIATAEAFGFNEPAPIDLPAPAVSVFPTDFEHDLPGLAQAAIGQNNVSATPLHMALVAAGIANEGVIMAPHLVADIRDSDGNVVRTQAPRQWRQAVDPGTAATLRQTMVATVEDGTARRMRIPHFEVGGKTGTAQLGTVPPRSHAWVIGFAGPAGAAPEVAVAVIVEGAEGVGEQTGGLVAAPIAQAVMAAALGPPG